MPANVHKHTEVCVHTEENTHTHTHLYTRHSWPEYHPLISCELLPTVLQYHRYYYCLSRWPPRRSVQIVYDVFCRLQLIASPRTVMSPSCPPESVYGYRQQLSNIWQRYQPCSPGWGWGVRRGRKGRRSSGRFLQQTRNWEKKSGLKDGG